MIAYWIMQGRLTGAIVNPYVLLGVFFMALFITCYFVDIHVDVAEALMVAFLAEFEIDQIGYKDMNIARESLKNAINDLDHDFALKEEQKFKHWVMIFCIVILILVNNSMSKRRKEYQIWSRFTPTPATA